MHALGIAKSQDRLRWALIKLDKTIVIERMEESDSIPQEVLLIKDLTIVTGLGGDLGGSSVLRRDLKLPLTTPRTLKAALPFQLEALLPFPLDQTVVYSQFHPSNKETFVVAWASTRTSISSHLEKWQLLGIDPDFISSETLALARYARHFFPDTPQLVILHDTLGIALDHDCVVCAMETPDSDRLEFFLKQKYPLFAWIDQENLFAIPIGLALEVFQKHPCQFRPKDIPSARRKKQEGFLLKTVAAAGLGLTLITALVSAGILYHRETKLKHQIAHFYSLPQNSLGSLEAETDSFRNYIVKELKTSPPVFNLPSTQEVLSWISTLNAPIEINHFEYELQGVNRVQVSLDFQAAGPSDADQFVKQLQQSPTFVESTHELKWTSHPQGYKLSFHLRKSF